MLVAASPYLFAAGVIASFVPALRAGEWIRQLPEPYGARVYDVGSRCTRITNDRTKAGGCSRGHGNAATARDAPSCASPLTRTSPTPSPPKRILSPYGPLSSFSEPTRARAMAGSGGLATHHCCSAVALASAPNPMMAPAMACHPVTRLAPSHGSDLRSRRAPST